ncbi:hypothetical protein TRFO_10349 [Tritrichomonas foetus]|uniref:Uncharacterized protein n=1 Tax=Tritrichomonas foetus TaxID=1144522 RepID=A0A1J4J952_9EUKA|nr:hypothetical protein TRFO_10349 [Tritrichomonas foetus]|eukprot:OHS95710.1 hypothetical protein TRFO_10349 [Tritrichomonas foetus]
MTDQGDDRLKSMLPFLFPGAKPEEVEDVEPPFHPDLEDFAFFEIYALIFEKMLPGEKVVDAMKRIDKSEEPIDDMAKWVSELFVRGEIDIVSTDWIMTGIKAGKVGQLQEIRWDLQENGVVTTGNSYEKLAPRQRVLAAEDAMVRPEGTEAWIPVDKIKFEFLV